MEKGLTFDQTLPLMNHESSRLADCKKKSASFTKYVNLNQAEALTSPQWLSDNIYCL